MSRFSKIYPNDTCMNESHTTSIKKGYKLAFPFIIILVVAIVCALF